MNEHVRRISRARGVSCAGKVYGRGLTCDFLIANLVCDTPEEARTLIPSLEGKISDDELETVLSNISKLRDFS